MNFSFNMLLAGHWAVCTFFFKKKKVPKKKESAPFFAIDFLEQTMLWPL
jgi:hypothetical protein